MPGLRFNKLDRYPPAREDGFRVFGLERIYPYEIRVHVNEIERMGHAGDGWGIHEHQVGKYEVSDGGSRRIARRGGALSEFCDHAHVAWCIVHEFEKNPANAFLLNSVCQDVPSNV